MCTAYPISQSRLTHFALGVPVGNELAQMLRTILINDRKRFREVLHPMGRRRLRLSVIERPVRRSRYVVCCDVQVTVCQRRGDLEANHSG